MFALAAASAVAVALNVLPAPPPPPRPSRAAVALHLDRPVDGSSSTARELTVRGRLSGAQGAEEALVTVLVDGLPRVARRRGRRFSATVVVGPGIHTVHARVEAYFERPYREVRRRTPTRTIARTSSARPRLDAPTAYAIIEWRFARVIGCGGDAAGCGVELRCFELSATHVDCPTGERRRAPGFRCQHVYSLRLDGLQVLLGGYDCGGPDVRTARGHVDPTRNPRLRRFRANERAYRFDLHALTYARPGGLPRFDPFRDEIIP